MTEDVRIAEVAALVGDPARANILTALMGGRALTAGEASVPAARRAKAGVRHIKRH